MKVAIGLAFLVVGVFLVFAVITPSEFRIARRITIDAPPEAVFPHIDDVMRTAGTVTIVESIPPTHARLRVDNERPFKSSSFADFNVRAESGRSVVEWTMSGQVPLFAKIVAKLFKGEDKMVGSQMAKALARLKAAAEKKS